MKLTNKDAKGFGLVPFLDHTIIMLEHPAHLRPASHQLLLQWLSATIN